MRALQDIISQSSIGHGFQQSPGHVMSVGDQITRRLRDAIAFAELPPGTRLKQNDLAKQFGTSRVPLREALRQLTAEGLIEWPSNKSAIVRSLDIDELRELFELGEILEARATRHGVPNLLDRDIAELRRLDRELRQPEKSLPAWYRTNLDFHLLPMLRSRQWRTLEIVASIRLNLTRYFLVPGLYEHPDENWREKHGREHGALCEAFEQRNAAAAKHLVEQHWRSTWNDWRLHLEGHTPAAPRDSKDEICQVKPVTEETR